MTEIIETNEKPLIADKQSFYFGLMTGVALVSLIGFILFASGLAKNETADTVVGNNNVANEAPAKPVVAGERVKIDVTDKDHFRGNKNAKVTIVEYSDIQCPYCTRFHETMKQVASAYPNDVKWVFRHFPLASIHPYAKKAAEGTECAADQGKFWELTDKYYENQAQLSDEYIVTAAADLKLDMKKFNDCLKNGKYSAKVDADMNAGRKLGVQGTPGSFINGISIPGALPFSELEQTIKAELSK